MELPKILEPIVFSTYYGSHLYGTNGPDSDIDVRGVFLPFKRDLLLAKAPKHYNVTGDVDASLLSIGYFLDLLTQGETNCLDMFFSYTNKKAQLVTSPIYEELIQNKDKLITKNIGKYLGYCKAQAMKYSIKGDRIQNLETFGQILDKLPNPGGITLGQAMAYNKELIPDSTVIVDAGDYIKNDRKIGARNKLVGTPMGEHVYAVTMDNCEEFLAVSGHLFPIEANITTTKNSINKCLASYGKRAFNAAADNGADFKALSHALRVAYQAEELLNTGMITFPLRGPKLEQIRAIKFKTTPLHYEEIVDLIEQQIKHIEGDCIPNTKLPDKPDYAWIEQFILNLYEKGEGK